VIIKVKKILAYLFFGLIFLIGFDFGRGKPFKRVEFLFNKQTTEEIITLQPRVIAKFIEDVIPDVDMPVTEQKPLVVIIPSYNNEKWVEKNLKSVINQQYDNFRLIYIDDNSSDNTYKIVDKIIENSKLHGKTTLIHNRERKFAMYNLYQAIHSCEDNEIIVSLDGDDWFAHPNVLEKINQVYQNKDVWLTYGQNIVYPEYIEKQCLPFDKNRLKQVGYRYHKWVTPQLRTFYAGLFKRIDYKDLMLNDSFLQAGCDLGYMFPMLEMSGGRYRFIDEILYVYNQDHSFNDHKIHQDLLISTWNYIKSLPPYEPLTSAPF
jgi:glycosyltransferase involved in cell wall biosynthesis